MFFFFLQGGTVPAHCARRSVRAAPDSSVGDLSAGHCILVVTAHDAARSIARLLLPRVSSSISLADSLRFRTQDTRPEL